MMLTEQSNPRTGDIDQLDTLAMVRLINDEDKQVALVVEAALPQIAAAVDAAAERMSHGGRLIYVGAGTSGRLGVLDAAECIPTFGVLPGLVCALLAGGGLAMTEAVEGAEDDQEAGRNDLLLLHPSDKDVVVGIAASGRTPYVLAAVELANGLGAMTVGISCNVPAPLLDLAQIKIGLPVGPEVIIGSTRLKAGTAQKMTLNMLSTGVMVKLGKVYGNLMVDMQAVNQKLAGRAQRMVGQIAGIEADAAEVLLQQANNEIKTAIVMHKKGVSADEARALLKDAGDRLRDVIG